MNTQQYHEWAFSYKIVQYSPLFGNSLWKRKKIHRSRSSSVQCAARNFTWGLMDNSPQQSQDSVQKGLCDASLFNMSLTIRRFNRKVRSNFLSSNLGMGSNQSWITHSRARALSYIIFKFFLLERLYDYRPTYGSHECTQRCTDRSPYRSPPGLHQMEEEEWELHHTV